MEGIVMWKVGVFIDADNISAELAEKAIHKLKESNEIRFIRAYGNWSCKSSIWKRLANSYGVETYHRYNITRSKNAADIALTVGATASLYSLLDFNSLAVVSSDSDFMPLIQHAQARGKNTIGMGCRKTPKTYTSLCETFHFLDSPKVIEIESVSH